MQSIIVNDNILIRDFQDKYLISVGYMTGVPYTSGKYGVI